LVFPHQKIASPGPSKAGKRRDSRIGISPRTIFCVKWQQYYFHSPILQALGHFQRIWQLPIYFSQSFHGLFTFNDLVKKS
jgi:hypothetical protein